MKRRVTIEDVAREAAVSRQTVSRAINGKGEISPETRERVLDAVRKLGFRPSSVARGLATRHTFTVGLVVPDITNPFFPEIARGVEDVARAAGYSVFLCNTDESPAQEERVLSSLTAQPVDGIVLCGSRMSEGQLAHFVDAFQPLVLVHRQFDHPQVGVVLVNNAQGVELAVDHLARNDHRNIGLLAGPSTSPSSRQRVASFAASMECRALPVAEGSVVPCAPTLEGGYSAAATLYAQNPNVTGILGYNDLVALGAVHWCQENGRCVPDDTAVVGFDDVRLASMVRPSLTTVRVDKYGLGKQAMENLLALLTANTTGHGPVVMDVELVVRESA